jgi:hypothetical protein
LNIGNCCLWAWRDNVAEVGADDRTTPSVSDALSSRLPGPSVPGFQNCMATVIFPRVGGDALVLRCLVGVIRVGMTDINNNK